MTKSFARKLWESLMDLRRPKPSSEPSEEKLNFDSARRESAEARQYAVESLQIARERMTWLESALTPYEQKNKPDWRRS